MIKCHKKVGNNLRDYYSKASISTYKRQKIPIRKLEKEISKHIIFGYFDNIIVIWA